MSARKGYRFSLRIFFKTAPLLLLASALPSLCVTLQFTDISGDCIYPGQCDSSSNSTEACHTCRDGYVKDPLDDKKCDSVNVTGTILIASDNGVNEITLKKLNSTTPQLHYGASTSSLDYNFQAKKLFWFSYGDKNLYAGPVNKEAGEKSTVAHDDGSGIRSISYDWIHENLYWTDIYRDEISVSNKNWTYKKALVKDGLKFPSSIVVNPLSGWMHWTDVFLQHIERAAMDGTRREVIVSGTDINYPRGLTIDFGENRIYWTQNEPSSISSSNFDGSDRKLIFTADGQQFANSYFKSITTFKNTIYWIDRKAVYSANKCDGGNLVAVYESKSDLNDIKVHDASRQPPGENICNKRIDECSHFCFPVPSPSYNSIFSRCDCPDGLSVSIDGNNCVRR